MKTTMLEQISVAGEGKDNKCQTKMEVPPNSLYKEEVNTNNDLGWRALGGDGGRKEPAITIIAGASSWRGSFTQCGGTPRMMAG